MFSIPDKSSKKVPTRYKARTITLNHSVLGCTFENSLDFIQILLPTLQRNMTIEPDKVITLLAHSGGAFISIPPDNIKRDNRS